MSKRVRIRVAIVLGLVALAVVLPPFINVGRFRLRLADSISQALGRHVTIGRVELRLLPEPGFALENFVVGDDPALSSEPMLRAEEVTANLRLASLWRGKLEIARLKLSYPSLNLVRGSDGKFNVESLLMRASQTPSAPTNAAPVASRPRFPYIEADGGRINFKSGLDKKVFSFTDADFALWSPAEDEWRMRLEGRPVRTDMPVNDTGTLTLEASFRRSAKLSETPVQIRVALERAQLGQLTKLVYGRDRGWRGAVRLSAQASGKPSNLALVVDGAVDDFRRFDIYSEDNIRLQSRCTGKLSSVRESIIDIACQTPLGDGALELRGSVDNFFNANFDLSVTARKVPISAAVTITKHAKKDLPGDLTASGTIDAAFTFRRADGEFASQGGGTTDAFVLSSNVLQRDLEIGRVEFAFQRANFELNRARKAKRKSAPPQQLGTRLEVLPFPVAIGGATPVLASAWIGNPGYSLQAKGDADLQRLLQVGRALGIPAPPLAATGTTKVDLKIGGQWQGFSVPEVEGSIQLQGVRAEVPGIAAPVQIETGIAQLAGDRITLQNINAQLGPMRVAGLLSFPRKCTAPQVCVTSFELHADQIDTAQLNLLLNPRTRKRPWYKLLSSRDVENSVLAKLEANGTVTADRFSMGEFSASKLAAKLRLHEGIVNLSDLRAEVFGGSHVGVLTADFSGEKPAYQAAGTVRRVAMTQLAEAMKDGWANGTLNATYEFTSVGWASNELVASTKAAAEFSWNNGLLRHISLPGHTDQLRFSSCTGKLEFQNATLEIVSSKLQTPGGIYELSGKASPGRQLEFMLTHSNGSGYSVTGSLTNPQVAALPQKQASAPLSR